MHAQIEKTNRFVLSLLYLKTGLSGKNVACARPEALLLLILGPLLILWGKKEIRGAGTLVVLGGGQATIYTEMHINVEKYVVVGMATFYNECGPPFTRKVHSQTLGGHRRWEWPLPRE